jgi:hypothetical protein
MELFQNFNDFLKLIFLVNTTCTILKVLVGILVTNSKFVESTSTRRHHALNAPHSAFSVYYTVVGHDRTAVGTEQAVLLSKNYYRYLYI